MAGTLHIEERLQLGTVARQLAVSIITLNLWRAGAQSYPPLPAYTRRHGKAKRVFLLRAEFESWLELWRPRMFERWVKCQSQK